MLWVQNHFQKFDREQMTMNVILFFKPFGALHCTDIYFPLSIVFPSNINKKSFLMFFFPLSWVPQASQHTYCRLSALDQY